LLCSQINRATLNCNAELLAIAGRLVVRLAAEHNWLGVL